MTANADYAFVFLFSSVYLKTKFTQSILLQYLLPYTSRSMQTS